MLGTCIWNLINIDMARIKIEDVIDHLDSEIRKALEATIRKHYPEVNISSHSVFRTFKRNVGRKCSVWESIPDHLVEK